MLIGAAPEQPLVDPDPHVVEKSAQRELGKLAEVPEKCEIRQPGGASEFPLEPPDEEDEQTKMAKGEAAMSTAIEEALTDTAPELKKRISVLWSLANIATLIGLLGTINGLIGGFAAIGKAAADQRSQILATKIAEAMNNTWLGLAIAATCMIGHLFLSAASKKQQQELESFALKLENLLAEVIANPPTPVAETARPEREGREGRSEGRVARRDERDGRGRRSERPRDADEDEE